MKRKSALNPVYAALAVCLLLVAVYLYYPHRKELVITEQSISTESAKYIDRTLLVSPNVVAIQIIGVDLASNTTGVLYTKIKNKNLEEIYSAYVSSNDTKNVPFFTKNDYLNLNLIRILNNEYFCSQFNSTLVSVLVPAAAQHITTVCAVSIPPGYGQFKGFVAIFLENEPTGQEVEVFRVISKELSVRVDQDLKLDSADVY
jgi:hypothetical protein